MLKVRCIDANNTRLLHEGKLYNVSVEHEKGERFYRVFGVLDNWGLEIEGIYMLKDRFVVIKEDISEEKYRPVEIIICGGSNVIIKTNAPKWILQGLSHEVNNLTLLGNLLVALGYQYSVENGLEEYYTLKS